MSCLSPSGTLSGAETEPMKAQLLEPLLRRRVVLASAQTILALTLSSWQLATLAREHDSGHSPGKSGQSHPGQRGQGEQGSHHPVNPHFQDRPNRPHQPREGHPANERQRSLPLPHRTDGLRWQSGGVSEDERADLRRAASTYNLWLVTAMRGRGEYIANARVTIWREPSRVAVLDKPLDGPWLLVDLPPGRYSVEARWHPDRPGPDLMQRLSLELGAQDQRRVTLHFPSGAPSSNPPRPRPRP